MSKKAHFEDPRPIVEPTVSEGTLDSTRYDHPAFGAIALHRATVMGNQGGAILFGSDFAHQSVIRISIKHACLNRHLSRDWVHSLDEIVTVEMSEAQWATFVSSMNQGDGVPCTIEHVAGKGLTPSIPATNRDEQFKREASDTLKDAVDKMKSALKEAIDKKIPASIRDKMRAAIQELEANVPFVEQSFAEHVEHTVERAKVEIHGYINGALHSAGLLAAKDQALQLAAPIARQDDSEII